MSEKFLDQSIEGVLDNGTTVELSRWSSDDAEYDARGWMDEFGDRVGTGKAQLPDQAWVDLSQFCLIRPVVRVP